MLLLIALLALLANAHEPYTSPEVRLSPTGNPDFSTWDKAVTTACSSHLLTLAHVNPSGACICYNIPILDAHSGSFTADLRVYRVSTGFLSRVLPEEIGVGVLYKGATASVLTQELHSGPGLLQSYKLTGQIDPQRLTGNMSIADLQPLVLPDLSISATSSSGETLTTGLLPNEASFLLGAFSKAVVMSDYAAAQAAVNEQLAALHNGSIPFVLPGTHFLIFPIGLVITLVWLALGLAGVGYGTYERIQYRQLHQRAVARARARVDGRKGDVDGF